MRVPVRLVYSLAHADNAFREHLSTHLHILVQHGLLTEWYEQCIAPGSDVAREQKKAWQTADILLLFLSADYFASQAFDEAEIRQALKRHQSGQILLLPLLVRPCDWQSTLLAPLQCLPRNQRPVSKWEDQDDAFLSIVQDLRQIIAGRKPAPVPIAPLTSDQKTNRQRLLKRVRTIWIDGMLEQSLQHAVWVDLHLQKRPDAVENPWRLVVQELDQEPHPLPPGTSLLQVLENTDEELLILGDPGAGKTTLLLYLARTLLDYAERDERRRMPAVFNLSSWARLRLPLGQWLLEELTTRYQVPRKVGQMWLDTMQIFPLLDGLDEVEEAARAVCVQAIITFAQQSLEKVPLIICCRTEEYQTLSARLPLQYAIMLLPFSDDQIETYLSSVSGHLDTLRETLHEDRDLFELARRPLMLSIFTRAYQNETSIDLPAHTAHGEYPRLLFRAYIKHMLKRRATLQQGTEEQIRRWLAYFATQMHQQTIFAVEELQPAWLPVRYRSWYQGAMTLVYGLIFSMLGGIIFWLTFGIVYGLIYQTFGKLVYGTTFGLLLGLVGGFTGGIVFGLLFRHHQTIHPAELTSWSWAAARKGLVIGFSGGLVVGLAAGLLAGIIAGLSGALVLGSVLASVIGLVGGLVGGLAPGHIPERFSFSPNEGIWRSGKRGLLVVLLFTTIVGLVSGWIVHLFGAFLGNLADSLLLGVTMGAGAGLVFGLAFNLTGGRTGIAAFVQHFVLRFFLWRLDLLPWQLVAFLDEATERLLLRRVGGSYTFVHRLLRDVLATQDTPPEKHTRKG